MNKADRFDWDMLMRFGMGVLGFGPTEFWNLTPREFEAALKGKLGRLSDAPPLERSGLDALIQRFPDKENGQ